MQTTSPGAAVAGTPGVDPCRALVAVTVRVPALYCCVGNVGLAQQPVLMVNICVPVWLAESVAVMLKVYVPATEGVPEITPVLLFSSRLGGIVPAANANVYGEVPPVAETVSEYGALVEPLASTEVQ